MRKIYICSGENLIEQNTTFESDRENGYLVSTTLQTTTNAETTLTDVEDKTQIQTGTNYSIDVELPLELATWYVLHVVCSVCVLGLCVCV